MRALPLDAKAVASLDRTVHEPARLAVVACLAVVDEADFVFLQSQTGMTGGNLSSQRLSISLKPVWTISRQSVAVRVLVGQSLGRVSEYLVMSACMHNWSR